MEIDVSLQVANCHTVHSVTVGSDGSLLAGSWVADCTDTSAYCFIMFPLLHTEFVLFFIGTLLDLTLNTIEHSNNTHCMFDTYSGSANTLPIHWLLLLDIVYGIGAVMYKYENA